MIGNLLSEHEILQYAYYEYFLAAVGLKTTVTVISELGHIVPFIGYILKFSSSNKNWSSSIAFLIA
jgi:hypothetical protein